MFDKEKLKQTMNDHGDTNKALAVFLGMTASNFSTIWNGRQPFQRKHIVRIAVRYQLSPQDVWDIFFLADAEAIKKEAREACPPWLLSMFPTLMSGSCFVSVCCVKADPACSGL